jgi:hypothetical protein
MVEVRDYRSLSGELQFYQITITKEKEMNDCIVCLYAVDMLTAYERGLTTKECIEHKWHEHTIRDGYVILACSECGVDEERMWK